MSTSPISPSTPDSHRPEGDASASEIGFVSSILDGEAAALTQLSGSLTDNQSEREHWKQAIDMIDQCPGHVVLCGMGKSGLVGAKISATMSSVGIPSHVVHPADAVHGDLGAIRRDDVVMLLSHSGRTEEVVNLATILKADGVNRLAVTASHDSDLARLCDAHLALGPLEEVCPLSLAPTTSTTMTLAVGDALALAVARRRCFNEKDFQHRHPGGNLGDGLRPIRELLRFRVGQNLPVLPETMTVGESLKQAHASEESSSLRGAGAIMLVDQEGKLSGIFTDGDLKRLIMEHPTPLDTVIGKVMTSTPRHVTEDQTLAEARQLVTEFRIDELPVVDDRGRPVGMIDVQDLMTPRVVAE